MPSTVPVRQLMYTNVEADRSPTNAAGLQVWRCAADLSVAWRRNVEEGAKSGQLLDAAPNPSGLVRYAGLPLSDGGYAVVRAVPLAERDKFNRGGRYFAHAAILDAAGFRRIGCDPFALIDGFQFRAHPDEAAPPGRPSAVIEDCRLPLERTPVKGDRTPPTFAALLAHVTTPGAPPVVIPAPPDEVLAVVRACVSVLPPAVRERFAFDTLARPESSGACRIAGSYSEEALRGWGPQKRVVYSPKTGAAQPALAPPGDNLPSRLLTAEGWAQLSDDERATAHRVAVVLDGRKTEALKSLERLSVAAGVVLEAVGARAVVDGLWRARAERELPAPLRGLDAVAAGVERYFGASLPDAVERLGQEIPVSELDDWLFNEFARDGAAQPRDEVRAALGKWLGDPRRENDPRRRKVLNSVATRWSADEKYWGKLEVLLDSELSGTHDWLRQWVQSTLEPPVRDGRPEDLAPLLALGTKLQASLREMSLRLAADPQTAAPAWLGVRLRTAFHRSADKFERVLSDTIKSFEASAGDDPRVALVTELLAARGVPRCAVEGERLLVGLLVPAGSTDARQQELLFKHLPGTIGEVAVRDSRKQTGAVLGRRNVALAELGDVLLTRLLSPAERGRPRDEVVGRLSDGVAAQFYWATWWMHSARGEPCVRELADGWLFGVEARSPVPDLRGARLLFDLLVRVAAGDARSTWLLFDVLTAPLD